MANRNSILSQPGCTSASLPFPEPAAAAAAPAPTAVSAPILVGEPRWKLSGRKLRRDRRSPASAEEIEAVYRENVASVFGFFSYSVGRDAAEDLTAATFERVVRSWDRFDASRATEQTWIFAIARNLLTDHLRRQRHRSGPSLDEHPAILESIASAEDPLAQAAGLDTIKEWLADLRPREREVLALRYCVDLSVSEVATCIGATEANVHQICSRALRRLRSTVTDPRGVSDSE
jgi:RNA polymerase sigma-70 factor, ECF subfamily